MVESPPRKAGNVTGDTVVLEDEHFELFDQLPKSVRVELANAPYPMAAAKIVLWMRECRAAGMEDFQIADLILYRFRRFLAERVKDECKKLYGPDHPQSGPQ